MFKFMLCLTILFMVSFTNNVHAQTANERKGVLITLEGEGKNDKTLTETIMEVIPAAWVVPPNSGNPLYAINIIVTEVDLETCPYKLSNGLNGRLSRIRIDMIVKITDLDTNEIFTSPNFTGTQPRNCRGTEEFSVLTARVRGEPNLADYEAWLHTTFAGRKNLVAIEGLRFKFTHFFEGVRVFYSPDGRTLVTATAHDLAVWDTSFGRRITYPSSVVGHPHLIRYSPNGTTITAVMSDLSNQTTISTWEAQTGKLISQFKTPTIVDEIAYGADGHVLTTLSSHEDNMIRVWDISSGKELAKFKGPSTVIPVDYYFEWFVNLKANRVLTLKDGYDLSIWDISTGEMLFHPDLGSIYGLAYSPDGKTIVITRKQEISIWDAITGTEKIKVPLPTAISDSATFSPDSQYVVVQGARQRNQTRTVSYIIDVAAGNVLSKLVHPAYTYAFHFTPDAKMVINQNYGSPSGDGKINIWSTETGKMLFNLDLGKQFFVGLSPDGKDLITIYGNTAYIWDLAALFNKHS
ncbi:MAG: PD40 domain-containing protein [Anaerolineae bacterium]|nr:PD40 domain-containing protein [Anaerolineae bacterium]